MDMLLLLAPSIGYAGHGDFAMAADGTLRRRREREVVPFVYAGAAILSPSLFADAPSGKFSLNELFNRAIEANRLFGLRLEGVWMHVPARPTRFRRPKPPSAPASPEFPSV